MLDDEFYRVNKDTCDAGCGVMGNQMGKLGK